MLGGNGAVLSPDRGRWITACNICTLKIPSEGQPLIDPCALMGRRRSLWPPAAARWGDAAALQPRAGCASRARGGGSAQPGPAGARCSHTRDSFGGCKPHHGIPGELKETWVFCCWLCVQREILVDGVGLGPGCISLASGKSWDVLGWKGP